MKFLIVFVGLTFVAVLAAAASGQDKKPAELTTVPSVDLNKYSGVWYEIAKFPNKFQKDCVGNTTATYTLKKGDGKLEVLNKCLQDDGRIKDATAAGKIADKTTNAKLKVRFAPGFLSFLGAVWADYWIIDLGENYDYAVIGEPKREYLWILSRKPEMSDAKYQQILRRVEQKGYNPAKLVKTPQNKEAIRGATIEN